MSRGGEAMTFPHATACIITVGLTLAGCMEDTGVQAARMEAQDDAACRKILADRPAVGPNDYQQCRQNLVAYRQRIEAQQAAAVSGMGTAMQNAGAALQGIGR